MDKRPLFTTKEKIIGGAFVGVLGLLAVLGLGDIAINKEHSVAMRIFNPFFDWIEGVK